MSRRSHTDQWLSEQESESVPYRLFFDSTNDAVLIVSLSAGAEPGPYVEVNKAACDLLGYTREELLAMRPQDIHAETVAPEIWQAMKRDLEEEGLARFERQLLSADGRRIPVEISCRVFWMKGGRYCMAICQNLSERQVSERILRERQRELAGLINASDDMACLALPDTRILQINEAGAARFGMSPEELIGKRILDLGPDDIRGVRAEFARRVVEDGETVVFDDFRNGMHLHHTVSPVSDDDGKVTRFAIFSRDITETVLRQSVDAMLNAVDRHVFASDTDAALIAQCCRELQVLFHSPLVGFCPDEGSGFHAVGPAAPKMLAQCRNRALMPNDKRPPDRPVRYLSPDDGDAPDAAWLFQGLQEYDVKRAVMVNIGAGHEGGGLLLITSQYPDLICRDLCRELFQSISSRVTLALEMLAEQQQLVLLRKALESARHALFIANRAGHIIWTNDAYLEMCGYQSDEVVGATPHFLEPGRHSEEEFNRLWGTILGGEVWTGEVTEQRKNGSEYTILQTITPVLDRNGEITHFIAIQEDISDRKRDEARIRYLADHCPLTDLHNRRYLMNTLGAIHRRAGHDRNTDGVALLYLDIDLFKQINDQYGHEVGDLVLKGFANRLTENVRGDDVVVRLGGDEFVILLRAVNDSDLANGVAQKILDSLHSPIICNDKQFVISTSIGISVAVPGLPWEPEELLRQADNAMYRAKALGRNRFAVYPRASI